MGGVILEPPRVKYPNGHGSQNDPLEKWLKMTGKPVLQLFHLLCPDSHSFYAAFKLLLHLSTKQQKQLQINSNQCKAAGHRCKAGFLTF